MSTKRRLVNQEFLKRFWVFCYHLQRWYLIIAFYSYYKVAHIPTSIVRTNDKELGIVLPCNPHLTNPSSERFSLRPPVESVHAIIRSCNLRHLESPPQLHGVHENRQRGFCNFNLAIKMEVKFNLSERQFFGILKYMIWSMVTLVVWKFSAWPLD